MTTHTFLGIRREVRRAIPCKVCGATCNRTFVGECTINPYNKNAAGEVCSREEVAAQSLASAERDAAKAEAEGVTCQWCADRDVREALIRFLDGEPLPESRWGSPTHILTDRKNIEERVERERCDHCGETAWKSLGYVLTSKGRALAERQKEKARARGEYPFSSVSQAA
jgi:hypothetical protein